MLAPHIDYLYIDYSTKNNFWQRITNCNCLVLPSVFTFYKIAFQIEIYIVFDSAIKKKNV